MNFISKVFKKKKTVAKKTEIFEHLGEIIHLLTPGLDPEGFSHFRIISGLGKIGFVTKYAISLSELKALTHLETLSIEKRYLDYTTWLADYDEYYRLFKTERATFINNHLTRAKNILKTNQNKPYFSYMLIRYEDVILTIRNTLMESLAVNNCIAKEVELKAIQILEVFVKEITEREEEMELLKKQEQIVINKSHVERLEMEERFIKFF